MKETTFSQSNLDTRISLKETSHKSKLIWIVVSLLFIAFISLFVSYLYFSHVSNEKYSLKENIQELKTNTLNVYSDIGNYSTFLSFNKDNNNFSLLMKKDINNFRQSFYKIKNKDNLTEKYNVLYGNINNILPKIKKVQENIIKKNEFNNNINNILLLKSNINKISNINFKNILLSLTSNFTKDNLYSFKSLVLNNNQSSKNNLNTKKWVSMLDNVSDRFDKLIKITSSSDQISNKNKKVILLLSKNIKNLKENSSYLISENGSFEINNQELSTFNKNIKDFISSLDSKLLNIETIYTTKIKHVKYMMYTICVLIVFLFLFLFKEIFSLLNMAEKNFKNAQIGYHLFNSLDDATKQLRQIILLNSKETRIKYSQDSSVALLYSLINKILEQRSVSFHIMNEEGLSISKNSNETYKIINKLEDAQNTNKKDFGSMQLNTLHFSEGVSENVEKMEKLRESFNEVLNYLLETSETSKKNIIKLEKMRSFIQSTSKLIKRLSESTQNIIILGEHINSINNKIKVLSLNIAVASNSKNNSDTEGNNVFSILAQELEQLGIKMDSILKDMNIQIESIQNDSRKTISLIENSTDNIVICHKMSDKMDYIINNNKNITESILTSLENIIKDTTDIKDNIHNEGMLMTKLTKNVNVQNNHLLDIKSKNKTIINSTEKLKNWLNSVNIKWEN